MLQARAIRWFSAVVYFAVAYGILFLYADSYFCSAARGQSRPSVSAKLALACTIWDALAGASSVHLFGKQSRWLQILVSAAISGIGFVSMPFWIYRGYGHFLFENTWADVSCFFTEGSLMMFPILVAPLLTAATVIRTWMVLWILPTEGRRYS